MKHKLSICLLNKTKDELIQIISNKSNRYGDKLLAFMDKYSLDNLQQATIPQLKEFIQTLEQQTLAERKKI